MHDDGDWARWRIELSAYGEYVELSFEDVHLRSETDATRWASELRLALSHYTHRVDVLLDLRGLHVTARCGDCCARLLGELLEQHAAGLSYFGADDRTRSILESGLLRRGDVGSMRSRSRALEHLMTQRRRRLSGRFAVGLPAGAVQSAVVEESGAVTL